MSNLIIFILILSILVLIHELGHFYAAKKAGVTVEEFGFGLPPKIFGKKIGETLYTLNLLPFGGFVKLLGEDAESDEASENTKLNPNSFASKSPMWRAVIISAGVFMNLVLAIVLYYSFFISTGFKTFNMPQFFNYNFRFGTQNEISTVVMSIKPDSPATDKIEAGQAIIEINETPVYNLNDIKTALADKAGQEISMLLLDVRSINRDISSITIVPEKDENGAGVVGVYVGKSVQLSYENSKVLSGPMHAYNMLAYSGSTLSNLVKQSFAQKDITPVSSSVAGPVGIFSVVGSIVDDGPNPVLGIIDFVALLSLTLALLNILPFPALDGGRLVFIAIEAITKRPVSHKVETAIHKFGMLLLLSLLVLVTIRDIARLI